VAWTTLRSIDDLVLRERAGVVEILAGSVVLLSSAALETELAFGRLVAGLSSRPPKHVVIGGLGFGATLRGVLAVAPGDARVVVVEKVAAVERLARGELGPVPGLDALPLDDPRVTVLHDDVSGVLEGARDVDAVLLDVDNGPHWASFRSNARLYTPGGLAVARRSLAPGGALAVWSGYPADAFLGRLRAAGFAPSVIPLHERGRVRARAYVGTKAP
jgi:spermidine synthase